MFGLRRAAGFFGIALSFLTFLVTPSNADIQVVKQRIRSRAKVSDTVREYGYQVIARNNGAAASGVTATVTSYDSRITVVSGDLTFPDMAPGAIAKSNNVFVIRRDKTVKLNKQLLRVEFSATSVPVANAGINQVRESSVKTALNASASYDPFGKPLTYAWSLQSAPGGSLAAIESPTSVFTHFTPDLPGDYVFSLTVSNGTNTSAAATSIVSTDAVPPIADAGRNQVVKKRVLVKLDGSASTNAMQRPLTYAWQMLSAPEKSKAVLSDPAALRPTFVADRRGEYRFQLIVSDGALSSAPSVVTVTRGSRRSNTAPAPDAGPDVSSHGMLPVILQAAGSTDLESDFLTFRWFVLSRPAGTDVPEVHNPNPIYRPDALGDYHLQVNVSDGKSESIATVLVRTERDVPPALDGRLLYDGAGLFPIHTRDLGSPYRTIAGAPGSLSIAATLLSRPSGSSATLAAGGTYVPGIGPSFHSLQTDIDGDYALQLVGTDEGAAVKVQSLGVTRGERPVAVVYPYEFVDFVPGLTKALDGTRSYDQDGLPLTYRWTLVNRPPDSNATISDPTAASPTITLDVDGTYVAQLIVSNGITDSLPASTALVNYVNQAPISMNLLVNGPAESPCIPVTLRSDDVESNHGIEPGLAHRRINSTSNGVLLDFIGMDEAGESTLCYRPRRFYVGPDQFSYETVDFGFPWGCGQDPDTDIPGCYAPKLSLPAFGNILVNDVPVPPM